MYYCTEHKTTMSPEKELVNESRTNTVTLMT